jgi:sugar phosphate isomerase/epimerase
MKTWQVVPSTTSHKREPLLPTLEVFSRLGMCDLDLNLHHLMEQSVTVDEIRAALAAGGQQLAIVSGGWCDFYETGPRIDDTFRSVDRQVALAKALGVDGLRLFFGRLTRAACSDAARADIVRNLQQLSARHDTMLFNFENHDGASLDPRICREILEAVNRPNIRMNFDPINFAHAGVDSMEALEELRAFVAHVHLKGIDGDHYCEFGAGQIDLVPVLRSLIDHGYRGGFTVEYEGPRDRTLRLYEGWRHASMAVERLLRSR